MSPDLAAVSNDLKSLARDRPAVRGVRSVDVVCVRDVDGASEGEKRTHSWDSSIARCCCVAERVVVMGSAGT